MTLFDLFINLIEGCLFAIFIARSYQKNIKNIYPWILLFSIIIFLDITYYNYYHLSELYCTFSILFICILFGYVLDKTSFIRITYIALIAYFCLFASNSIALFINQTIFSVSLPFPILIIISKIIFSLFVFFIPPYLKVFTNHLYTKNWSFNLALISMLTIYTLTFDALFYQTDMNLSLYVVLLSLVILTISICKLIHYISQVYIQEAENKLLKEEMQLTDKNYRQIERSFQELSRFHHDSLYVLNYIKKLNQGNNLQIDNFINEQIVIISKNLKPIITGNSTLDYVIYEYIPRMKQYKIDFTYNYMRLDSPIPKNIYYSILTKMMDTALESCYRHKNSKLYLQHGTIKNNFYTKLTYTSYDEIKKDSIEYLDLQLSNYDHVLIHEKEKTMTSFGFMIITQSITGK